MSQDAVDQLTALLGRAGELREKLSNGERLQLMGLASALLGELEKPDEAIFRMTFNDVSTPSRPTEPRLSIALTQRRDEAIY